MRNVSLPVLIALFVLQARPANNFALTVDNIMRGPALVGYEPTGVRWSPDGSRVFFQWKQNTDKEIAPMDTYTVNRDGSGLRKLTGEEVRQLPPALGDTTKDKRLMVYSSAGDLYTLDNNTGKVTQLTKTTTTSTVANLPQTILITSIRLDGDAAAIQYTGTPRQQYILQANDSLNSGGWSNISTNQSDAGGNGNFRDTAAKNYPTRFYRIATP